MAALLTSTSAGPKRATTAAHSASTSAELVMSAAMPTASFAPDSRKRAAKTSSASALRSVSTSRAPASASAAQCSRPSKPSAPLTTATFPERSKEAKASLMSAGLPENGLNRLAAQAFGELAGGQRRRQRVERAVVSGQHVGDLLLAVSQAQVVKARPQHAVPQQLLLHQRLLQQRVARAGVEGDDRTARQADGARVRQTLLGGELVVALLQLRAHAVQVPWHLELAQIFDRGFGGGQRQRLTAEGREEEHVFFEQAHHVGAAGEHRERHAVGHGLGKAGQIRGHIVVLLGTAERHAEAGPHLVEHEQGAGRLAGAL